MLTIVIPGDCEYLARIIAVRAVETLPVVVCLIGPVDDVAKMKQKRGIESAGAGLVISGHLVGNLFGIMGVTHASVAKRVKPNFSEAFNFLDAVGADYLRKIHATAAGNRRNGAKLLLAPVRDESLALFFDELPLCGGSGQTKWVCVS